MQSLLKHPRKINPNDIRIEFSPIKFEIADPTTRQMMEGLWNEFYQRKVALGKQIENLENYRVDEVIDDGEHITLRLSIVDYATKIAFREYLRNHDINEFPEDQLPRGIGIGGLLKTSDGKYIFGQKSGKTNAQFSTGFIGGIPTRDEIEITRGLSLAAHLVTEIYEETGVMPSHVQDLSICDIILSDSGSIMILTETTLNLTEAEVTTDFNDRIDLDELTQLLFVQGEANLRELLLTNGSYYTRMWDIHNTNWDSTVH